MMSFFTPVAFDHQVLSKKKSELYFNQSQIHGNVFYLYLLFHKTEAVETDVRPKPELQVKNLIPLFDKSK